MPEAGTEVLVVDDHQVVREGLRVMLEHGRGHAVVVRDVATVAEARAAVAARVPDVAIVDVMLPDGDGIQLCRDLRAEHPELACLVLTSLTDGRTVLAAAMAGASGFLRKDAGQEEVVATVEAVTRGEMLLDETAVEASLEELRSATDDEHPLVAALTPQERRVYELVGQGLSNRQISEQLFLSEKTIKNYVSQILAKLHMARRTEIAALAARLAAQQASRPR